MSQKLDLKEVERNLYQATLQDGLTEVYMGVYLALIGLAFSTSIIIVGGLVVFMPLWAKQVIKPIKKRWVYPRMGYVSLKKPDQPIDGKRVAARVIGLLVLYIGFLIGSFLLTTRMMGYEQGRTFWYSRFPTALAGLMIAASSAIPAYLYKIRRWYALSALALISGLVVPLIPGLGYGSEGFRDLLSVQLASLGSITSLTGLSIFLHFVYSNSVLEQEVPDGAN